MSLQLTFVPGRLIGTIMLQMSESCERLLHCTLKIRTAPKSELSR